MKPNFELVTELQTLTRRDFPVADPTLLQPVGSNPLIDGEFLELNANYMLTRDAAIAGFTQVGATKESANIMLFPLHTERGRYDTQAIGKANVLMLGMYEAETQVADLTGLVVGAPLTVQTLTGAWAGKRGLKLKVAADGVVVVGYVSKLVAGSGKLRFVHFGNALV
jgi:hypothetical protein